MTHIPPRFEMTPEKEAWHREFRLVNDLFVRWVRNELTQDDALNFLKYQTKLEEMRTQMEWRQEFDRKHYEWKVAQMNLKNSDDSNIT